MARKAGMSNQLKEEISKELGFYHVVQKEGGFVHGMQVI